MRRNFLATTTLLILLFMLIQIFPTMAWDYTDGVTPPDTKFEQFGPRANNLLINLYFDAETEWDALEAGEVDVTDWPLTQTYYNRFTTPPQNYSIDSQFYGAERGIFYLDINWNNNEFLGNPPDPIYPNPVYPNNPFEHAEARQAIWHLHDKPTWLPIVVGPGFYMDLNTTHPPVYGSFALPSVNPYPYNTTQAGLLLDSIGVTGDDGTGYRYYDLNDNGIYDGGDEYLELHFAIRSDNSHRLGIADLLADEMATVGLRVSRHYGPSVLLLEWWFYGKKAHFYTAGLSLGVEPYHTRFWLSDFYWHPGICYNTGYVNDPELDTYTYGTWLANTEAEALTNCLDFQRRFCTIAAAVPWFSYAGSKAVRRRYTGGTNEIAVGDDEDPFRGQYWDGVVNVQGYGLDSFFSFLNMHPRGFERGDGNMTIRYGMSTDTLKSFNPIYAATYYEWKILDLIYEPLLRRNPYNPLELLPWLVEAFEISTYEHPVYGTSTKVKFTLRPDIHWADGTPLTLWDIFFTWVELPDIIISRGLPPPWLYSSVAHILSFAIYDAYNFEVLMDVKSIYATMWVGGSIILPMHVWKPLAEGTMGDVQAAAADPDMIGNGPYRFVEYVANSHVLLTANEPDKTVTTNHAGSTAVYSPTGYVRYFPGYSETYVYNPLEYRRRAKILYELPVEMRSEYINLWDNTTEITTVVEIDDAPIFDGTQNVPFMEKAYNVSLLFAAKGYDYGYSWWHKYAEVGPLFDIWAYHKILYIYATTLLVVDIDGTPIYTHSTIGWVKIHVIRYMWTFDYPYPECTKISSDYELSWHTLKTDISGGTWYDQAAALIRPELMTEGLYAYDFAAYPYKYPPPTPDIKVDIKDVAFAAKAFGSYPGHGRWSIVADINGDYKIDIKDITPLAKQFGWVG